jgi:hypothetical protein
MLSRGYVIGSPLSCHSMPAFCVCRFVDALFAALSYHAIPFHSSPCLLVLCMQSRGYVIGGHLANALLSITQQMAAVGHRDFVPYDLPTAGPAAGKATAA